MSKVWKLLLGAVTVWPVAHLVLFVVAAFHSIITGQTKEPTRLWEIIIPLHLLTILIIVVLMAFYVVNVIRNDRIKSDMKAVWAIVIVIGGPIALPIYWYFFIWKDTVSGSASREAGPL